MKKKNLMHLATRIFDTPLMIQPAKLDVILSVLAPRFEIDVSTLEQAEAFDKKGQPLRVESQPSQGIAVLEVCGTLVHRVGGLDALSGMQSYGSIREEFDALVQNPAVRAIVLDVDSPGGEVAGAFDLAAQVYAARGKKPIYAIANEMAFSAAYLIASAADKVFVPPTGKVGSIGVVATHVDVSDRDKMEGLKITHIYAGDKKVDMTPHKPLSEGAARDAQMSVDTVYQLFVEAVSRHRGMKAEDVTETRAGIFLGKAAVKAGLADAVKSATEAMSFIVNEVTTMGDKTISGAMAAPSPGAKADDADKKPALSAAPPGEDPKKKEEEDPNKKPPFEEEGVDKKPENKVADPKDKNSDEKKVAAAAPVVPAVAAAAEVVDPVALATARAADIVTMCSVVGHPEKAIAMIRSDKTTAQCRKELFDGMSDAQIDTAIRSAVSPLKSGDEAAVALMRDEAKKL